MREVEILNEIEEITQEQEEVISSHGAEVISMFRERRHRVMQLASLEWELDSGPTGLDIQPSEDELQLLSSYVCTSSFISAWYHLAGIKKQRDKAAHSCSNLISGLGFEGKTVLTRYISVERLWRQELKHAGLAPKNFKVLKICFVLVAAFVFAYIFIT